MNRIYLPLILLAVTRCLYAQTDKFGKVSIEELSMKTYEKDTNAAALILFDKGSTTVEPTLGTKFKRHIRIKILKRDGFDLANVKLIPKSTGSITRVVGATYNIENGELKLYNLIDTLIMKSNQTKNVTAKVFALPNVRVGSVIEYEYTERDGGDFYLPSWQFQHTVPCLLSEYSVYIPIHFVTHMRGELKPTSHESKYDGKSQKWVMKDIPAFVSEPLMPNKNVFVSQIEFTGQNSWFAIYRSLVASNLFGGVVFNTHSSYFKKEMESIKTISDDDKKIKAIVELVKQNVEWNEVCDFYADPPEDVIRRKKGSAGDINLLLGNLLKKAGYNVSLLLLRTKDRGFVLKDFTSKWQYNYVVCLVHLANSDLILDATEKLLPYQLLPERCFNYDAMYVSETELDWVTLNSGKEKVFVNGNFKLTAEGELIGTFNYSNFDYSAFHSRKLHQSLSDDDFNKQLFDENTWTIKKVKTQGLEETDMPLIDDFEVTIPDAAIVAGDITYFNPVIFFKIKESPFIHETRKYPIDLGLPHEQTVTMSITIPDNYTIDELPKNQIYSLPNNGARYIFSIVATGNKIQLTTKFLLNQTFFTPEEYISLKEFYKRLVAKHAESIVFKKVK
jgi:hypothetical protein